MEQLLHNLFSTWWGITLFCVFALLIWVLISALFYRCFFKRFYDIVLSGFAILVLSPILLVLIVLGAIKMKGNPFFTQLRPGKNEKIFKLIKFRTMTNARDENGNLLPDDKRLTKYGKILRSTSLDELPELFNIFVGHMSIVGPRPLLPKYLPYYTEQERRRHNVRPGLTGHAQVHGRNAISWDTKLQYDVEYVNKLSLMMDVRVLFLTVYKVFKRADIQFVRTPETLSFVEQRKLRMEEQEAEKAIKQTTANN